jgi:hypothetical protein
MEESKAGRPEYGFNPLSRRWVKKSSDAYLRLIKAGIIKEEPEVLSQLTADRREATRRRLEAMSQRRAEALVAEAAQRGMSAKPAKSVPPKAAVGSSRLPSKIMLAALRDRLARMVKTHDLASSCSSIDELAERLSALAAAQAHDEGGSESDSSEQ